MVSWLALSTWDPLQLFLVLLPGCWHCVTLVSPPWGRALRGGVGPGLGGSHSNSPFLGVFSLSVQFFFPFIMPLPSASPHLPSAIFFCLYPKSRLNFSPPSFPTLWKELFSSIDPSLKDVWHPLCRLSCSSWTLRVKNKVSEHLQNTLKEGGTH